MGDQPLKIARDKQVGKDYLLCDYNRDGDSYRSPWSNAYDPPLEDGAMPTERLRKLEVDANTAFDQYREMYFEGGVSSVYLWDLDHGFAGVILIKKAGDGDSKKIKGCWDSIHVVEVQEKSSGRSALVADQQGQEWHHEPGWITHTPGRAGRLGQRVKPSYCQHRSSGGGHGEQDPKYIE